MDTRHAERALSSPGGVQTGASHSSRVYAREDNALLLLIREVLTTKVGNKLAATVRTLHNRLIVPAKNGRFVT